MKNKTLKILTIVIGVLTVSILVTNTYILFMQTEVLRRTSPSRTAYLKTDFSQFKGDDYFYSGALSIGEKRNINFIFLNIGSVDTGRVVVTQEQTLLNFQIEHLIIENIPAGTFNESKVILKVINTTNIRGSHDVSWRTFCANCFDQEQVIFKEAKIIVPEN